MTISYKPSIALHLFASCLAGLGAMFPLDANAEGKADIAAGKALATHGAGSVPACSSCHGADGGGQAAAGFPRLAGLDPGYIQAQLAAFADGSRVNTTMGSIAKTMDAKTRKDAGAYYASLPAPAPAPSAAASAQILAGGRLADRGNWGANIPACASCHGKDGRGVGAAFPAIADQPAAYIIHQLEAWKGGTRQDDPLGLMHTVAMRLTGDEIAAVAAYYAALPGASPTSRSDAK